MLIEFLAFVCISSLFMIKWHLEHHFRQFQRLGIPGPVPSLLFGNLGEIRGKGQFQAMKEWTTQFGHIFGFFEGYTPVLSVSDPDILKEILVKDSANFMKRKPFPLAPRKSLGLFLEDGAQWRRSRTLLTPAFSTGKLKMMMPVMSEAADILVEKLADKSKENRNIDIYSVFQSLTLDVIGRCAFGLQCHAQRDEKDAFLVTIRTLFHTMTTTIVQPIVMVLPFTAHFIFFVKNIVFLFGMNPVVWLRDTMREVIRRRKALGPNASIMDLVQLMLFPEKSFTTDTCPHPTAHGSEPIVPLTEREIVAQSMTFLLAGYETTSAVLACFCHELAKHPEIQAKLHEEIAENIGKQEVNYESMQNLEYFDAVFDEICRLYPTGAFIVTRQAAESRQYDRLHIPAAMNILANVWALHRNPAHWTRPLDFWPDRFLGDNRTAKKSFAYLPFGLGPRHCIGMRFATLETKITIVKILQHFLIEPTEDTQDELELFCRGAIVPYEAVKVKITKRPSCSRRRMLRHS